MDSGKRGEKMVCRFCGEEIPADATACPVCGSDEKTGWSEQCCLDGAELPLDDDEYQELVAQEFGAPKRASPFRWWHALAGAVVLGLALWGLLSTLF